MPDEPPLAVPVAMVVPDDMTVGVYANHMTVWNVTAHDFTLDFAVIGMPEQGEEGPFMPAHVVSRIRVPPSLIFQIATAIAHHVDGYEAKFGPITPRPPDNSPNFPPEDS